MGSNLKKLANFFNFSLLTDQVSNAMNLPQIDVSMGKIYRRSSSLVQRSIFPTSKGNRELYL